MGSALLRRMWLRAIKKRAMAYGVDPSILDDGTKQKLGKVPVDNGCLIVS